MSPWLYFWGIFISCVALSSLHERIATERLARVRWWRAWNYAWRQIEERYAIDCARDRADAEPEPASQDPVVPVEGDTGIAYVRNERRSVIVIRGQVIGVYNWGTRAEYAESMRHLAKVCAWHADYAEAAPTGKSGHPIDQPDVTA